jgi:hypothetical protein
LDAASTLVVPLKVAPKVGLKGSDACEPLPP